MVSFAPSLGHFFFLTVVESNTVKQIDQYIVSVVIGLKEYKSFVFWELFLITCELELCVTHVMNKGRTTNLMEKNALNNEGTQWWKKCGNIKLSLIPFFYWLVCNMMRDSITFYLFGSLRLHFFDLPCFLWSLLFYIKISRSNPCRRGEIRPTFGFSGRSFVLTGIQITSLLMKTFITWGF